MFRYVASVCISWVTSLWQANLALAYSSLMPVIICILGFYIVGYLACIIQCCPAWQLVCCMIDCDWCVCRELINVDYYTCNKTVSSWEPPPRARLWRPRHRNQKSLSTERLYLQVDCFRSTVQKQRSLRELVSNGMEDMRLKINAQLKPDPWSSRSLDWNEF